MARPKKDNADYFSHDAGMRNHRKVKALRTKYGHEWFSLWMMMLEHLCSCDHFLAKYDEVEKEILAGDFSATCDRLDEVVGFLLQIGLLQKEGEFIKSQSLIDRMAPMIEKRERERKRFLPQDATETTQSKGKESKVKESIEEWSKIDFKQKARAVETKWNYIIKIRNDKTWRNDMMEQSTFQSFLNLIYNLDVQDFEKRVSKFIAIKKFIITNWIDKYLAKKIQWYDISMFLKNINLFATDDKGIIASIAEREFQSKVSGMYAKHLNPEVRKEDPIPMKSAKPMDPVEARKKLQELKSKFLKK